MKTITCKELKQNLNSWLGLAEKGKRIQITRDGKPIAILTPVKLIEEKQDLDIPTFIRQNIKLTK